MSKLIEQIDILRQLGKQPRSSLQINKIYESDCEILKVGTQYLCSSIDNIGEEIQIGLYQKPETWGWMMAAVSISDLAASGALPLGLLVSTQWQYGLSEKNIQLCFQGLKKALSRCKVPLLGGDSGHGSETVLTSTILGQSMKMPLTRTGICKGDYLILIGKKNLGLGPAFGFEFLFRRGKKRVIQDHEFRPVPQPELIHRLRPFSAAAIDTSDGLGSSLQILSELNHVGFEVDLPPHIFHPKALKACTSLGLHHLLLAMGEHGDYQTLLAVPEKNLTHIRKLTTDFTVLGKAKGQKGIYNKDKELPTTQLTSVRKDLHDIKKLVETMNRYFRK